MNENLSISSDSKYPFYDTTFKTETWIIKSNINKYIKKMSLKMNEQQGNHPRIGIQIFVEIVR